MTGCYLLHRTSDGALPAHHKARHYLGSAVNIQARLLEHSTSPQPRLIQVWQEAGAQWECVRTWETTEPRDCENKLKRRTVHNGKRSGGKNLARLCPVCKGG